MTEAIVIDLGVGRYQMGGDPREFPPRIHLYTHPHGEKIGSDVPAARRESEPILTLVFHNRAALDAMRRAIDETAAAFPIDMRMVL